MNSSLNQSPLKMLRSAVLSDQCLLSCAINAYLAEKQPLHCRVIIVCRPLDQTKFTLTHVHRVGDAIQPSLSSPSPPTFNLSQHQGMLFK